MGERVEWGAPRRRRARRRVLAAAGLVLADALGAALARQPPYPPFLIDSEPSVFDLQNPPPRRIVKGSLSLGGVHTTGAGNTTSANGKLYLHYGQGRWQDHLRLFALYGTQDGSTTARRYAASDTLRYYLSPRRFLFANAAALQDRFAGYAHQFSETAGYGWRVLHGGPQLLDLELGAGLAQTREVGARARNGGVARLAVHYRYRLDPHSKLSQTVEVLADHNTYTQAVSALDVSVYGNIGLQLSYTITHNSETPPGAPSTTTITSVNLLYGF